MMYVNIVYKIFYWSLLWLNTTKMRLKKLLITTGKMPAARWVRTNTSGLWPLNSFPIVPTAKNLALLPRKQLLANPAPLLNLLPASLVRALKNLNKF